MKTLFFQALILSFSVFFSSLAYADASEKKCYAGCENPHAPAPGNGRSVCWVTLVAPDKFTGLEAQIFDDKGNGILRNAKKQIAIRGGKDATRVSIDCKQFRSAVKLVVCAKFEGKDKTRTFEGAGYTALLPPSHKRGGYEVKL